MKSVSQIRLRRIVLVGLDSNLREFNRYGDLSREYDGRYAGLINHRWHLLKGHNIKLIFETRTSSGFE